MRDAAADAAADALLILLSLFLIDISTDVYVLGYMPGTQQCLGRWISQHQTLHRTESGLSFRGKGLK